MKLIRTEEAVGHVLCHDMTQIIKDQYKDARFRKGHIVTEDDIPVLLSMGKENLYVWEMTPGMVHENDAAERLLALCGQENVLRSETKEGKIELTAACSAACSVSSLMMRGMTRIPASLSPFFTAVLPFRVAIITSSRELTAMSRWLSTWNRPSQAARSSILPSFVSLRTMFF